MLDLQLTRLALAADDPAITAICASGAVASLRDGPAAAAFRLGQDAISLLDRHHQAVPLDLVRQTANAAITSGDGEAGEALLGRAVGQAEAEGKEGTRSARPESSLNEPATSSPAASPHRPNRTCGTPTSCSPPADPNMRQRL